MKCPKCDVPLMMTERQSVEVDYCPNCRGVWLDRGELDKIIDRAAAAEGQVQSNTPGQPVAQQPYPPQAHPHDPRYQRDHYYKDNRYYKKRKSFLSEIFDFD